ncbi:MAG: bacterial Ig-like domain-containing protein [Clostridia bacterium]|nr:bacterial Ig-like domain-containing protein [Clostridia bacterium]
MKRFLAVLICIFMLVSLLPAFAFAQEGACDDPAMQESDPDDNIGEGADPLLTLAKDPTLTQPAELEKKLEQPAELKKLEQLSELEKKDLQPVEPEKKLVQSEEPEKKLEQKLTSIVPTGNDEGGQQNGGGESPATYSVTVSDDGNGTGSANPASGATGTEVTLSAVPNTDYVFKEWQVISGGVTVTDNKFTIGTAPVEVKAIFEAVVQTTDGDGGEQKDGGPDEQNGENTISITHTSADVAKGGTLQFSLSSTVQGTVTWTVSNNKTSESTSITGEGLLTVGSDETATSITVTATWGTDDGQTATATVNVKEATATNGTLEKIEIAIEPTKTEYTAGETFDATGMVVTATYSDDSTKAVTGYTYPAEALAADTTSVIISYTEGGVTKTATQSITVNAATGNQPSFTSISASHGKVSRGEIVTFTAVVKDDSGQPLFKGDTKLYINGSYYTVSPEAGNNNDGPCMVWKIHATESNGFVTGENTITVKYPGSSTEMPSGASVKLTVTKACKPKPVCKPTHYCCGQNHFTGKCVTVRSGEDVTFKVELGCNERCQWYVNRGDGCGFVKIKGADSPTLTVKDVTHRQDGYRYRCVIRNCCETIRTPIFTLNVASGQLYTPKTGDSFGSGLAIAIAAIGICLLTVRRRAEKS